MSNYFINVLVNSFSFTNNEQFENIKNKYKDMPDIWLDVNKSNNTVKVYERVEWEGGDVFQSPHFFSIYNFKTLIFLI